MDVCLSPNGSTVYRLAEPPRSIAVATIRGVVVLARQTDDTWAEVHRGLKDRHIGSLLVEPESGTIFAGAHDGGLFASVDGGETWELRASGDKFDNVFCLALARLPDGPAIFAGTQPVSLFRSRDLGHTWTELPTIADIPGREKWTFPAPPHVPHTKSILIDRRNPEVIYAAIEQGALLKTIDGGKSWRELESYYHENDFWYRDIHRVVQLPSNPDTLLMTSGMGLYRSEDAGESWQQLTDRHFRIGYPDQLIVSPADDQVLYMAGGSTDPSVWWTSHAAEGTVMRSENGGRSWSLADSGLAGFRPNVEAMCVVILPSGYSLITGNTDGAVHRTNDGGRNWVRMAQVGSPVSKNFHYRNVQPQ